MPNVYFVVDEFPPERWWQLDLEPNAVLYAFHA